MPCLWPSLLFRELIKDGGSWECDRFWWDKNSGRWHTYYDYTSNIILVFWCILFGIREGAMVTNW